MKRLSHFSAHDSKIDFSHKYVQWKEDAIKPNGLWLSDESDYGWKKWCEDNAFNCEGFAHSREFECDTSQWAVLDSDKKLLEFSNRFHSDWLGFSSLNWIDWIKVAENYKGILITPYSWNLRLRLTWYYGWDCASACVWDLSTICPIGPKT